MHDLLVEDHFQIDHFIFEYSNIIINDISKPLCKQFIVILIANRTQFFKTFFYRCSANYRKMVFNFNEVFVLNSVNWQSYSEGYRKSFISLPKQFNSRLLLNHFRSFIHISDFMNKHRTTNYVRLCWKLVI